VRELPPGAVLRLLPSRIVAQHEDPAPDAAPAKPSDAPGGHVLDALWRETLRQSARFDVAAGVEDGPSQHELEVSHDAIASVLTVTLKSRGEPPLPVASAPISGRDLTGAIDALALATRQALGERDAAPALPCDLAYSRDAQCVRYTERAQLEASRGFTAMALGFLLKARPLDPGCAIVAAALAAVRVERGEQAEAEKIARDALVLERRLTASTKHRLARTLLRARGDYAGLLALADVTQKERPHDAQVTWSKALALSLLGRQAEAAPLLRTLATRWPKSGAVRWHLSLAELAEGRHAEALATIEGASGWLPPGTDLRPKALALFHLGQHERLRDVLLDAAAKLGDQKDPAAHELGRMRISLALLTGRGEDAAALLLEDLAWMRARPSRIESLALDLVEDGEVLVLIGHARDLEPRLAAFAELVPMPDLIASACTYLGGLVEISLRGPGNIDRAEAALRAQGHVEWSSMLRAAAFRRKGEMQDEARALNEVVQATDKALARASLARVLRSAGQERQAKELLDDLRKRLMVFAPLELARHPLLSPSRALAWLATSP
jgi:tetratricopeptide (TPR) repeat protein